AGQAPLPYLFLSSDVQSFERQRLEQVRKRGLPPLCRLLSQAEESLNRGQDSGGGVLRGVVRVGGGGEALATFGHDKAQRFDEGWVGIEDALHCGVADFEDFSLLEREYVRGPRFAGKQSHLAEEVAFVQGRDRARAAVFI